MTAPARKRTRREGAPPPAESRVYDGRRPLGVISPKGDGFVARTSNGRSLGALAAGRRAVTSKGEAAHG